jgi:hypothetical protein
MPWSTSCRRLKHRYEPRPVTTKTFPGHGATPCHYKRFTQLTHIRHSLTLKCLSFDEFIEPVHRPWST